MQTEKLNEKSIEGSQKDKRRKLVPNVSYGEFFLGKSIDTYKDAPHDFKHYEESTYSYDNYYFYTLDVELWVENDVIKNIRLDKECFFEGENLIKMDYDYFIKKYNLKPDNKEVIYMLVNDRGKIKLYMTLIN